MIKFLLVLCLLFKVAPPTLLAQSYTALSVDDCIEIALQNNPQRAISEAEIQIAKSQLGQARSAYWPQINTSALFARLDEAPLFIFPEETDIYSIGGVFPQPIQTEVTIPEKQIQLLGKNVLQARANITLPLYTSGLRSGLTQQARAGVETAHQKARLTHQEIVHQIRRLYYATVLANKLAQLGQETLERLEVTLELTENLYLNGSGKVMKTDYLKNKIFVESIRGIQIRLQNQAQQARSGLTYHMGLTWNTPITLSETDVPFQTLDATLPDLIQSSLRFNPNYRSVQAGFDAYEGKMKETKSETRPQLALLGNLEYLNNNYDKGIAAPQNKKAWQIGLGLELPLFNGFRTQHKQKEIKAKMAKLEKQELLLRDGLATQIKVLFQKMQAAQQHLQSANTARTAAQENRHLTEMGYQADLLDVQDVIQAQITEALMQAQYEIIRYDHYQTRIEIEKIVGTEIESLIQ